MKNLDYNPDSAHLPSEADKIRWKKGGREKNLKGEKMVQSTIEKFNKK